MEYNKNELFEVLKMFNNGSLNVQGNAAAIEKLDVLKHLERRGYIRFFPIEENDLPPVVLLTLKGEQVLKNGGL